MKNKIDIALIVVVFLVSVAYVNCQTFKAIPPNTKACIQVTAAVRGQAYWSPPGAPSVHMGLRSTLITLRFINSPEVLQMAYTGAFGYYEFPYVEQCGHTYEITAVNKHYDFEDPVVIFQLPPTPPADFVEINFRAQ